MLEILYQDEWLVAVNKPSGWLVHRSWLDRDEKVVVMQTVRDQIGQHVFTAHRLDRPTSGVLLMGFPAKRGACWRSSLSSIRFRNATMRLCAAG
ncbi:tRNA pseudouridine synthase C [Citrobacter koseri]|uniref:tRNA pseudouridine synthase C n=1 Tax=Citrobacter koseri TaxID=545 RepID=A0A2X2YXP6_CITKO|nr:tRNA pseudouridine synthase C [Citrobacter koseri]